MTVVLKHVASELEHFMLLIVSCVDGLQQNNTILKDTTGMLCYRTMKIM
jgi:hypothetical protein